MAATTKAPLKVCVTGAGGLIGYSLVPMIAAGNMFGPDQPVILTLLDINAEFAVKALAGLKMELEDCVYPLLKEVIPTQSVDIAFKDVDYCVCCGAFPRKQGMERKDLLAKNAGIFREQGSAIKEFAKPTVKVVVIGNPANTNALLAQHFGSIPTKNITALTRLDQNRARNMIARRVGVAGQDVKKVIIWGNHSATQYPDANHGTVTTADGRSQAVRAAVNDDAFLDGPFISDVQQRGAAVISTRGASSATSAARAIVDHVHDWHLGTAEGDFVSMGVWSDGNPYGIADGLIYSFPVTIKDGEWSFVADLPINDRSRELMEKTQTELQDEKKAAFEVTGGAA